jgi:hypothetical protein
MRHVELAWPLALLAPLLDVLAILVELDDAVVGIAAVAIATKMSPLGATRMSEGALNVSCVVPATPGLPSVMRSLPS